MVDIQRSCAIFPARPPDVDLIERQHVGQRIAQGVGVQGASGGELGEYQSEGQIAHAQAAAEADLGGEGAHGSDVAVGLGAQDVEGIGRRRRRRSRP